MQMLTDGFAEYTDADKLNLEELCMLSLADDSKSVGILYIDLLDGNFPFRRFNDAGRELQEGLKLEARVQFEKTKLSQTLQRLKRRRLVEIADGRVHPSVWQLTMRGWDAIEYVPDNRRA